MRKNELLDQKINMKKVLSQNKYENYEPKDMNFLTMSYANDKANQNKAYL